MKHININSVLNLRPPNKFNKASIMIYVSRGKEYSEVAYPWPFKLLRSLPESTSHSFTVASYDALKKKLGKQTACIRNK